MNQERFSSIHKIVGGTEEEKKNLDKDFESKFSQERWYQDAERKKTVEEVNIINFITAELNTFLGAYGGTPLAISDKHVHMIDGATISSDAREYLQSRYPDSVSGFYDPEMQDVLVFDWKVLNHLDFAQIIIHELVHFLSYNAMVTDGTNVVPQRIGFAVQPNSKPTPNTGMKYFNWINEAMTQELAIRFESKLKQIPELKEDLEKIELLRQEHDNHEISALRIEEKTDARGVKGYEATVKNFPYEDYRSQLHKIIKGVFEKNQDKFTSEEEVFVVFARAYTTGDVKKMAALIDSTFGSGSFRKIAQVDF